MIIDLMIIMRVMMIRTHFVVDLVCREARFLGRILGPWNTIRWATSVGPCPQEIRLFRMSIVMRSRVDDETNITINVFTMSDRQYQQKEIRFKRGRRSRRSTSTRRVSTKSSITY